MPVEGKVNNKSKSKTKVDSDETKVEKIPGMKYLNMLKDQKAMKKMEVAKSNMDMTMEVDEIVAVKNVKEPKSRIAVRKSAATPLKRNKEIEEKMDVDSDKPAKQIAEISNSKANKGRNQKVIESNVPSSPEEVSLKVVNTPTKSRGKKSLLSVEKMEVIEEKTTNAIDTQTKTRPKRSAAPVTKMEVVKDESPLKTSQIEVAKAIDSPTKIRSKKSVVVNEVSPIKTLNEISEKEGETLNKVRAKKGLVMSEQIVVKLTPVKLLETNKSLSPKEKIESQKNRRKTNICVVKPSPEKELNTVTVMPTKTVRKTRLFTSNVQDEVVEGIQDNVVSSKSHLLKSRASTKEVMPQVDAEVINATGTQKIPGLTALQNLKKRKSMAHIETSITQTTDPSSKIPGIESLTEIRRRKSVVPTSTEVTKSPPRSAIKKNDSPEIPRLIKTKSSPVKETKNEEVVINKSVRKTRLLTAVVQEDLVKDIENEIVSSKPRPLKRKAAIIEDASEVDCGNVDGPISKVAKTKDQNITDSPISTKITKVKSVRPPISTSSKVPGLNSLIEIRGRKSAIAASIKTPEVANEPIIPAVVTEAPNSTLLMSESKKMTTAQMKIIPGLAVIEDLRAGKSACPSPCPKAKVITPVVTEATRPAVPMSEPKKMMAGQMKRVTPASPIVPGYADIEKIRARKSACPSPGPIATAPVIAPVVTEAAPRDAKPHWLASTSASSYQSPVHARRPLTTVACSPSILRTSSLCVRPSLAIASSNKRPMSCLDEGSGDAPQVKVARTDAVATTIPGRRQSVSFCRQVEVKEIRGDSFNGEDASPSSSSSTNQAATTATQQQVEAALAKTQARLAQKRLARPPQNNLFSWTGTSAGAPSQKRHVAERARDLPRDQPADGATPRVPAFSLPPPGQTPRFDFSGPVETTTFKNDLARDGDISGDEEEDQDAAGGVPEKCTIL